MWLIRHGETEWSRSGQHTGRTDLPLTPAGEEQAEKIRSLLDGITFDLVLCSPMLRTRRTAELAGLGAFEIAPDLREWDYGELEGRVTPEIRSQYPGWSIWDGPWPGGETAGEVTARADRVVKRLVESGLQRIAVVGHGHFTRALVARWVGEPVGVGRWLELDIASVSEVGWSKGARVLRRWNRVAAPA